MRVVVDTNVIVSGLLVATSPPGEIVKMIATGVLQLCYDARIVVEYKRVLGYSRFPFTQEEIDAFILKAVSAGFPSGAAVLSKDLPDKNDNKFLEVALSSKVEFLVTRNIKHFPAHAGVKIVTPRDFMQELKKRS